jgi:hypothetical protein
LNAVWIVVGVVVLIPLLALQTYFTVGPGRHATIGNSSHWWNHRITTGGRRGVGVLVALGGIALFVFALSGDLDRRCRTLNGAGTVRDWARRQLHETLVHRWDLQDATGKPRTARTDIATDCVSEVVQTLYPRQIRLGRVTNPEIGVALRGGPFEWVVGTSQNVIARVHGPVAVLAQLVWRRVSIDDDRLRLVGDRESASTLLATALTP